MAGRADDEQRVFCTREHGRLVGALHLYTGDRDLAGELAQEALARACRDWAKVARMDAPGAWVHRVALNLAHSYFRRRGAERRARARLTRERRPAETDPADAIALRGAITRLPRRQRQAVVLRYYTQLSVAETATAMGCRPGTVRALTSQGLDGLRAHLATDEPEEARDAR